MDFREIMQKHGLAKSWTYEPEPDIDFGYKEGLTCLDAGYTEANAKAVAMAIIGTALLRPMCEYEIIEQEVTSFDPSTGKYYTEVSRSDESSVGKATGTLEQIIILCSISFIKWPLRMMDIPFAGSISIGLFARSELAEVDGFFTIKSGRVLPSKKCNHLIGDLSAWLGQDKIQKFMTTVLPEYADAPPFFDLKIVSYSIEPPFYIIENSRMDDNNLSIEQKRIYQYFTQLYSCVIGNFEQGRANFRELEAEAKTRHHTRITAWESMTDALDGIDQTEEWKAWRENGPIESETKSTWKRTNAKVFRGQVTKGDIEPDDWFWYEYEFSYQGENGQVVKGRWKRRIFQLIGPDNDYLKELTTIDHQFEILYRIGEIKHFAIDFETNFRHFLEQQYLAGSEQFTSTGLPSRLGNLMLEYDHNDDRITVRFIQGEGKKNDLINFTWTMIASGYKNICFSFSEDAKVAGWGRMHPIGSSLGFAALKKYLELIGGSFSEESELFDFDSVLNKVIEDTRAGRFIRPEINWENPDDYIPMGPRPEHSVSEILKQIYFDYGKLGQFMYWTLFLKPEPGSEISGFVELPACINDEEKFWYSMCYLKHGENKHPDLVKVLIRVVQDNIDINPSEVAKTVLSADYPDLEKAREEIRKLIQED